MPAEIGPGDAVTGATINKNGSLVIEAGKVVCHGTCILLKTKQSNGDLLVKGKTEPALPTPKKSSPMPG